MENEYKEHKHKRLFTVVALALALTFITAGFVSASYILTSNHISGSASPKAILTITANNTNVVVGDTLQVVAHLNDSKAGVPIQFYNGTTILNPSVNTDTSGNAIVYYVVAENYDMSATTTHP